MKHLGSPKAIFVKPLKISQFEIIKVGTCVPSKCTFQRVEFLKRIPVDPYPNKNNDTVQEFCRTVSNSVCGLSALNIKEPISQAAACIRATRARCFEATERYWIHSFLVYLHL